MDSNATRDRIWRYWFTVPIYPYSRRRTIRQEVIPEKIWTFDQLQGIFYVVVPIRMTVVRLEAGGLLVYAPVAPTRECLRLMNELVEAYGPVKYIILPTVSGIEHKEFVGPFARKFPQAQVFVAPDQWSFPIDLPLSWLGLPGRRTQRLPENSADTPFADEFDYARLGPITLGLGPFEEVAFFCKQTRTLLVTDAVLSIPKNPPEILQQEAYPLLFHARETALDPIEDTPANRRKGWQRISLFAFYFSPRCLDTISWSQAFQEAKKAPDRSKKAYFGLYPFRWQSDWQRSFAALRQGGRLLVAPILQTLILNRDPKTVLDWADKVASWDFQRLIPCHFDAPVATTPRAFREAFVFLEGQLAPGEVFANKGRYLPEEDLALLENIDRSLTRRGITPPRKNS
jgi:hypothetical protein